MSDRRNKKRNASTVIPMLEPLLEPYEPSPPIAAKFFNITNRMAEVGWLPDWQLKDAVRELLVNMIDQARTVAEDVLPADAVLEFAEEPGRFVVYVGTSLLAEAKWGKKMLKFTHSHHDAGKVKARAEADASSEKEKTQYLELINYSSTLPFTSFYVGHSTKRDNLAVIGKHGEGLTGACVVLNRHGCNVFANCTHHGYEAEIVRLGRDVFFQLERKRGGNLPMDTVRFRVMFDPRRPEENVQELMASVRLSSAAAAAGIATAFGTLLLELTLRGKQFNRSIYVGEDANCFFGYDFLDPEKTLLQGRDRNAHTQIGFAVVCAAIISEAILQSEGVREEVLKCFLYAPNFDPNGPGGSAPKLYIDLKDGMDLTLAAIDTLRRHYEQNHVAADKLAMFIAVDTPELKEIRRLLDLVPVFCLPVLHNHTTIVHDFRAMLVRDAQELDPATRVGALQDPLRELLQVRELKQSGTANAKIGFWVVNGVGYVTAAHSIGPANAVGLTHLQQLSILQSLRSANVDDAALLKVIDLLRQQPVPEPVPEPMPETEPAPPPQEEEPEQDRAAEEAMDVVIYEAAAGKMQAKVVVNFAAPVLTPKGKTAGNGAFRYPDEFVLPRLGPERKDPSSPAEDEATASEVNNDDVSAEHSGAGMGSDSESDCDEYLSESSEDSEDSEGDVADASLIAQAQAGDNPVRDVDLPTPKRQRLDLSRTNGANTSAGMSAKVIDLSSDTSTVSSAASAAHQPRHYLLHKLPKKITLSSVHHPVVCKLRFYKPCGVWLYSDNADSEHAMLQQLEVCVPSNTYRAKLRTLSSLCHIVVFLTADKRAPLAFNHGPHMCVNLGACKDEQGFRYLVNAQVKSLNLFE